MGRLGPDLPTHEINAAINTNKSTSSHIPNQAIILNWQISRLIPPGSLDSSGSTHLQLLRSIVASWCGVRRSCIVDGQVGEQLLSDSQLMGWDVPNGRRLLGEC